MAVLVCGVCTTEENCHNAGQPDRLSDHPRDVTATGKYMIVMIVILIIVMIIVVIIIIVVVIIIVIIIIVGIIIIVVIIIIIVCVLDCKHGGQMTRQSKHVLYIKHGSVNISRAELQTETHSGHCITRRKMVRGFWMDDRRTGTVRRSGLLLRRIDPADGSTLGVSTDTCSNQINIYGLGDECVSQSHFKMHDHFDTTCIDLVFLD
jgi:hypothetical protein